MITRFSCSMRSAVKRGYFAATSSIVQVSLVFIGLVRLVGLVWKNRPIAKSDSMEFLAKARDYPSYHKQSKGDHAMDFFP